ncbi:MAG: hypothetical protein K6E91_14600 [Butyrivibrio sp.]|nr:hypothetical protein [Butyrivibrio sp.]
MKTRTLTVLLSAALMFSCITACGASNTETPTGDAQTQSSTAADSTDAAATSDSADGKESTDNKENTDTAEAPAEAEDGKELPATLKELVNSLCAGQAYTYAPVFEGENALLVTSYAFDDLNGHQATYEATIFIEKDNHVEKVTTVQSGGTAYPIALSDDNSLILSMRNSLVKGYVSKDTGKFVITEESDIDYSAAEEGIYHNYKDGSYEIKEDSSLFDELSDKYQSCEVLSFTKAGISEDSTPRLSGAVYAAYKGDDLYNISEYYIFDSETSGSTQTSDGLSGLPFSYEQNGEDITFHFGSSDDTQEARFSWKEGSYPALTFTKDNETVQLLCLGNCDPATFDAAKYYDNDNNLYMIVKKFDETTLTGDLYRNERIEAQFVDNAKEGDLLYSVNGTQFMVVSFEEANKELEYGTDDEFKKDVVGKTRFGNFILKSNDDNNYYALTKEDYEEEYSVVSLFAEGNLRASVEENVTFNIKENCEITLQKFVLEGDSSNLKTEYIIGREFKGDNYPNWSEEAKEYYMTSDMLVALGVIDGELYNITQIFVP